MLRIGPTRPLPLEGMLRLHILLEHLGILFGARWTFWEQTDLDSDLLQEIMLRSDDPQAPKQFDLLLNPIFMLRNQRVLFRFPGVMLRKNGVSEHLVSERGGRPAVSELVRQCEDANLAVVGEEASAQDIPADQGVETLSLQEVGGNDRDGLEDER